MSAELIEYVGAGRIHQGYLAFPARPDPAPCVLVLHDWSGVSECTHEVADEIAQLGYVAFAVDLYGKGLRGETPEQSARLMQPFIDRRERIVDEIAHALGVVRRQPRIDARRMAAVGFCFGGLCALDLARRGFPLQGVVSVHGVLAAIPGHVAATIDAKILVLQGNDDPLATSADVTALGTELSQAGADWQCHVFGRTRHAFTNPAADDPESGIQYNALAHARARRLTEGFLQDLFGPSNASP